MRRSLSLSLGAATLVLAAAPSLARANEADTYGLGSRSTALGGAVAADAPDFSANYYNPAGLVGARGLSLSLGYTYAANHLSINGADNKVSNVHGIVGGLAAPGKAFGVPFAFGLGVYIPDSGLSRIKALRQETPRWALYDERSSIIYISANIAIRPVSWLELGGGVTFLAATKGTFQISGVADVVHPYDSQLRHEVDADLASVRYPQLGARVKLDGFGYLGLVYRGQTRIKLDLTAHLHGNVEFSGLEIPLTYDLSSKTNNAFLPQQVVLGASFQRIKHFKANVDFTFVDWAAYESPTALTVSHLKVALPPGVPITLPADPKVVTIIPPGFQNRVVPHVGLEYVIPVGGAYRKLPGSDEDRRLIEIPVRAGYVYELSPVPPQTGTTNFVDADRHTVSLGTGLVVNGPFTALPGALTLDLHASASILPERVTHKANAADFVGDYRQSGNMLGFGTTLGVEF